MHKEIALLEMVEGASILPKAIFICPRHCSRGVYTSLPATFEKFGMFGELEEKNRLATILYYISGLDMKQISGTVAWNSKILCKKVVDLTDNDSAMLQMQGGNSSGVPTVFLFQTDPRQ